MKTIFNGILVGGNEDKYWVSYFEEIKPHKKDNKGEELSEIIYQTIRFQYLNEQCRENT